MKPTKCALFRVSRKMSDSEKTEADSTTQQEESKKEENKEEAALPTNGSAKEVSNGLSAQLDEKIIRQVEVVLTTWSPWRGFLVLLWIFAVLLWGQEPSQGQIPPVSSCREWRRLYPRTKSYLARSFLDGCLHTVCMGIWYKLCV